MDKTKLAEGHFYCEMQARTERSNAVADIWERFVALICCLISVHMRLRERADLAVKLGS